MLNNDSKGNLRLTLIDFGYAKSYRGTNEEDELDEFEGNILFASQN